MTRFESVEYDVIKDEMDLYALLKLMDITTTEEECQSIFKEMKENKYYIPLDSILTEIPLIQIIRVWEINNIRVALWSNHRVELSSVNQTTISGRRIEERYNFLDKGNYGYDGIIILWEPDVNERLSLIRYAEQIKERINGRGILKNNFQTILESIDGSFKENRIREELETIEREKRKKEVELKERERKEFETHFKTGIFETETGISVNKDEAEYGGLVMGINGWDIKNLYYYPSEVENVDFVVLYNRLCEAILLGLSGRRGIFSNKEALAKILTSKVNIKVGGFEIAFKRKKGNGGIFIDNIKIARQNFGGALKRALYYSTKEEYHLFLMGLKHTPIKAMELVENGISFMLMENRSGTGLRDEGKAIHWDIKKDNDKYYLITGKKEYESKVGYQKLCPLKREVEVLRRRRYRNIDKWGLYQKLSPIFGKKESLEIVEAGLEYYKEIEKRAEQFFNGIVLESNGKIEEGTFDSLGQGWYVKGIKNRYFVAKDGKAYFVEPQEKRGMYICIITPTQRLFPKYDKIASVVLALLNDQLVAKTVHTLV